MADKYQTYWLFAAEKVTDFTEVERRVLAGENAIEVTHAMQERAEWRRQQVLKAAQERQKALAEMQFRRSLEGRRQAALQRAAESGGAIVSTHIPDLHELERYGPSNTNPLR